MRARIDRSLGGSDRLVVEDLPSEALGHQAVLKLLRKVHVHDSRAVHDHQELQQHAFRVSSNRLEIPLREPSDPWFSYEGEEISLRLVARLEVDDGVLFDTTADAEIDLPTMPRTEPHQAAAKELIEPNDRYSLSANIAAIPLRNKLIVLGLLVIGGMVALVNAAIGIHDEFVPESATVFYDHRGSDGSESPIMKSLVGSGGLGLVLWAMVRAQLRRYMRIQIKDSSWVPYRGLTVSITDLFEGQARVPLEQITVRVVAVNLEKGQYRRGSGTKERTVSFSTPRRGVVLYEQFVPYVPAHTLLQHYVQGQVDFTPMFDVLYPPLQTSSSHGLALEWEVQLLHPLFVDQELKGRIDGIDWREFYQPQDA